MTIGLNFAGKICLDRLIELADELRVPIESGSQVTLDGDRFSRVDFVGIQMLLAAHRRSLKTGATLRVRVPQRGALREALGRYGYGDRPPLPFVEAA